MFILDKPYVSELLRETVMRSPHPVLKNPISETIEGLNPVDSGEFAKTALECADCPRIYCNSENSIDWISAHLSETELPEQIDVFKNKARMRRLVEDRYPGLFHKEIPFGDLDSVDVSEFPFPFVIKPTTGFFSLGVHPVAKPEDWPAVLERIKKQHVSLSNLFPDEVLDATTYLAEECIMGPEYAVDAYYDENGEVVILNILKHLFASADDVSDRVYFTSQQVMKEMMAPIREFLEDIGKRAKLRNFPVHVELRETEQFGLTPIEVNPMRFAGFCCTDVGYYAWGINTYEYYLQNKRPDWDAMLAEDDGRITCMIVAQLPNDVDPEDVSDVDYDAFTACFSKPLDIRRIDWKEYPVIAFVFAETTQEKWKEIEYILHSDLKEFLTIDK